MQAVEVVDRAGGERRGGEDGLGIALQYIEPVGQVLRVIEAREIGDLEPGTEKSCRQFGDEFLEGIGLVTKALAEFSVEAMLRAAPMDVMPISA
mgnify:CR=1 FL=1